MFAAFISHKNQLKMKNVLLLLMTALLLATACNKDDDPSIQEQIRGVWTLDSFISDGDELIGTFTETFGGIVYQETNTGTIEFRESNTVIFKTNYVSKEDGVVVDQGTDVAQGTYTLSDDKKLNMNFQFVGYQTDLQTTVGKIDGDELEFSGVGFDDGNSANTFPIAVRASK